MTTDTATITVAVPISLRSYAENDRMAAYNMNAGALLATAPGTTWKVEAPMCPQSTSPVCSVSTCNRPSFCRGWCRYHYQRWRNDHMATECSVKGCQRRAFARGWCHMHYQRWRKHGDTSIVAAPQYPPFEERFWSKVEKSSGCWAWTGHKNRNGYGWTLGPKGKGESAHRIAYELLVGPIPEGLQIDHLCRNRACVNPDHLEPVTQRVNWQRGNAPSAIAWRAKRG